MQFSRRNFLKMSALAAGTLAAPRAWAQGDEGPVNWLSWGVYDVPEVIESFQQSSKLKVNVINFEDNSTGFLKVKQDRSAYDVVMADGFWPRLYHEADLVQPLDLSAFSSAEELMPAMRTYQPWSVNGGLLQYPNAWSAEPIMYRKSAVKPFTSAWDVWSSEFKNRVVMYDSPTSIIPAIATWLGYDFKSMTAEQLDTVKKRLIELKPNIRTFAKSSGEVAQALAAGAGDIGFSASQSLIFRIKDAGGGEWGNIFPKEGVVGWVDGNMLVKDAAHEAAARKWINHHGGYESQVAQARVTKYATTNEKAVQFLKNSGQEELVANAQMDRWELLESMLLLAPPDNLEDWLNAWNEFKAA